MKTTSSAQIVRCDPNALDTLLVEATTVALKWRSLEFREACARECDAIFLPGLDEVGACRFHAAIALRGAVRALGASGNDMVRQHLAIAISALAKAIKREPPKLIERRVEARPWWLDK